ncbi:hypothetical protein OF83DRAFT_1089012 [Amylostereum chailletii]|nr:hypothetical protein OF83DRAFT_1089012 [Amylostereum chailletii]
MKKQCARQTIFAQTLTDSLSTKLDDSWTAKPVYLAPTRMSSSSFEDGDGTYPSDDGESIILSQPLALLSLTPPLGTGTPAPGTPGTSLPSRAITPSYIIYEPASSPDLCDALYLSDDPGVRRRERLTPTPTPPLYFPSSDTDSDGSDGVDFCKEYDSPDFDSDEELGSLEFHPEDKNLVNDDGPGADDLDHTSGTLKFSSIDVIDADEHENLGQEIPPEELEEDDVMLELESDPLFRMNDLDAYHISRGADLDPGSPDEDDEDSDHSDDELPPAFSEPQAIRNFYIHQWVSLSFYGASHQIINASLVGGKSSFRDIITSMDPGVPPPFSLADVSHMAETVRTMERRLRIDPDRHIVYYALCPVCWKHYPLPTLLEMNSARCDKLGCDGVIFRTKRMSSGKTKRYPSKLMPTFPILSALQLLLDRPGKYEECQFWRKDGDHDLSTPISRDEWRENADPSAPMTDIHDGWLWRSLQAGISREWDPEAETVLDVNTVPGQSVRFVSLPCGLVLGVHFDWFGTRKRGSHSSGVSFLTVQNLPRSKRLLRENMIFFEIFTPELAQLESGVHFRVYNRPTKELVHATLPLSTCDTPARLKAGGYVSQNSLGFMCYCCDKPFDSLTQPHCFDSSTFQYRKYNEQLRDKFRARDALEDDPYSELPAEIATKNGVRFSALDALPNWQGPVSLPLEPMHNFYLGVAADLHKTILLSGGMFVGTGKRGETPPSAILEACIQNLHIPASMGRLNPKIATGGGRPKADDWRNLMTVYPVVVAISWGMWDHEHDESAHKPRKNTKLHEEKLRTKNLLLKRRRRALLQEDDVDEADLDALYSIEASQNYHAHYINILRVGAALRILGSCSLSLVDAARAQLFLEQAFQSWASMGCHLKPNFHAAAGHSYDFIEIYATMYAIAVWAHERCIGILARMKTNGRSGGELECTLMRGWWKTNLCQELLRRMLSLEDRNNEDNIAIEALLKAMRGGAEGERHRGTLMTYLAAISEIDSPVPFKFPSRITRIDLRAKGLYPQVLRYAQEQWPDRQIVEDYGMLHGGSPLYSHDVPSYPSAHVSGVKYCAASHHRGGQYCFGYIQDRQAVQLLYLLTITLGTGDGAADEPTEKHIAIVRRFENRGNLPTPPWEEW